MVQLGPYAEDVTAKPRTTVYVLNGLGETVAEYTPPTRFDDSIMSWSEGGVQFNRSRESIVAENRYRPQVERQTQMALDQASAPGMLFLPDDLRHDCSTVDVAFPYTSHVHGPPRPPGRDRGSNVLDTARNAARFVVAPFRLAARVDTAIGVWVAARAAAVRTGFLTWVDAPRQAEGARRLELMRLREGAAEQAVFADANGMPQSAKVWRRIAEQRDEVAS